MTQIEIANWLIQQEKQLDYVKLGLTPEMFAQLAVKMTYPVLWKEKIVQNKIWEFQKTVKKGCKEVAKEKWTDIDKYDLFFI